MMIKPEWIVTEHGGVAHAVNGVGPGFVYHTFCGLWMHVSRPACRNCGDTQCKICRRLSRRRTVTKNKKPPGGLARGLNR